MPRHFTASEESAIRYACREQYKQEGTTRNPYQSGTIEALIWIDESQKIMMDEDRGR